MLATMQSRIFYFTVTQIKFLRLQFQNYIFVRCFLFRQILILTYKKP
jgi:hypothetical protein